MPTGYVIVDPATVRDPDGRDHSVLDAIKALPWTLQLCPLMRHEYSIWQQGPEWAWNVISAMLLAKNPDSFRAYFRGYQTANRYWDAPDGLRYWRGRFEIDRGQPDGAGQRRVDEGARTIGDWDGPPWAPNGIGLYERDARGAWWPTEAAVASGYQRCTACERTTRKADVVATPKGRPPILALIAAAQDDRLSSLGRGLTREELTRVLSQYPDTGHAKSSTAASSTQPSEVILAQGVSDEIKRVIERLLDMREAEGPLGHTGYRGAFSQKVIAKIAGVPVQTVTRMAIERDRRREAGEASAATGE